MISREIDRGRYKYRDRDRDKVIDRNINSREIYIWKLFIDIEI